MLTGTVEAVNNIGRLVVLRHPNAYDVVVSRKVLARTEIDPVTGLPSESAGQPTLGGMGVLRTEDEAEYSYEELGAGKMMLCGIYDGNDVIDADNAYVAANAQEARVEALAGPGDDGYFVADSGDLIMVMLGMGVVQAWEVSKVKGKIHIPPYTRNLILNPRDDLSSLEPFELDPP